MVKMPFLAFCFKKQARTFKFSYKQEFLQRYYFASETRKVSTCKLLFIDGFGLSREVNNNGCFEKENICKHSSFSPFTFCCLLKKTIFDNFMFQKNCFSQNHGTYDKGSGKDLEREHMLDVNDSERAFLRQYENWSREVLRKGEGHSVFVIQPYIKWGERKKTNTTTDLQLGEAVALVNSLQGWQLVECVTVGLKSFDKKSVFGSGNFKMLKEKIQSNRRISAVFINIKMLRGIQHREIENAFQVPVFDRYLIVMKIFQQHAVTREAKLQVAMAEIPYIRSRLRGMHEGELEQDCMGLVGGTGAMLFDTRKSILMRYESKLKEALQKLKSHRELLRSKRRKQEYPVVAVVGYTNAGKTSIIKSLTGDVKIQPENRLFATLDVTNHMGLLPCGLKVLYVDTVGFISDIPTELIESFVATLEDAMLADVILHVEDESHPDKVAQAENVNITLRQFNLSSSVVENIVIARNKADLIPEDKYNVETEEDKKGILVSAVTKKGLLSLLKKIESAVLRATGRISLIIRVPMGSEEASWLYREVAVTEAKADERNNQYLLMQVIMTDAQLNRFKHYFITSHSV